MGIDDDCSYGQSEVMHCLKRQANHVRQEPSSKPDPRVRHGGFYGTVLSDRWIHISTIPSKEATIDRARTRSIVRLPVPPAPHASLVVSLIECGGERAELDRRAVRRGYP